MKKKSTRKFGPRVSAKSEAFFTEFFSSANGGVEWILEAMPDLLRKELSASKNHFTADEKKAMVDVCNGLILTPMIAGEHLAIEIEDGAELDDLDQSWDFDAKECSRKIASLTPTQRMMIELWAVSYWLDSSRDLEKYVE